MNELDLHYPPDSCPFCNIAAAFPAPASVSASASTSKQNGSCLAGLSSCVPGEGGESDPEKTTPSSFIVLSSPDVVAFLDILPMTRGHLLVASREHRIKVENLEGGEARDIGFWLPLLARTVKKVTGVTDYNIVQNNGARAAQVVPHVHFHIIPRPGTMPELKNKSWTMFGRGQRDDLDDEEGDKLAGEMRKVLRDEICKMEAKSKL